jgi:hypothetical protein
MHEPNDGRQECQESTTLKSINLLTMNVFIPTSSAL